MPLQPPAQHQCADGAADLQPGAGERCDRLRRMGGLYQDCRRPTDEEEVAHQVEDEDQPGQRRDHFQSVVEQIFRIGTRELLFILDDKARIGRHAVIRTDRRQQRHHLAALALVQGHVFDRFGKTEDRDDCEHDRGNAADQEQDLPAVMRYEPGGGEAGQRAADWHHPGGNDGERRAHIARRRFGINRHEVRDDAAYAEPGDRP